MHIESFCAREIEDGKTTAPHILPIYATSSFVFESIEEGIGIFAKEKTGHVYSRYGNPTIEAVASKIAGLESFGMEEEAVALLFSSGMSAISTLVMSVLKKGDKILTQPNLYGGTTELFSKVFHPLGIETVTSGFDNIELVDEQLKADASIKLIFCETPANPSHDCVDLEAIAEIAGRRNVLTAVDNTFATPYLQQPLKYGFDYIIHSTTKYLNGHGNSIAGALVGRDKEFFKDRIWQVMKLAGTNCSPWEAWLVHNGLKTLALRMERHSDNAMAIARYLYSHPKVQTVNYCGLPEHAAHLTAKKQMRKYGGVLSFDLKGGLEAGIKFMNATKLGTLAPTLGDVDTLVLHPASSSHLNIPKEIREKNGIPDGLIRISVGIENIGDLIDDLEQSLEKV